MIVKENYLVVGCWLVGVTLVATEWKAITQECHYYKYDTGCPRIIEKIA